jgi:hypothetical protein
MFEAFIGLLVACFVKKEVKDNKRLFDAFKRNALDVKLFDLHVRCSGFVRGIDPKNAILGKYWNVVNRRNDALHGNVDPVKDAIDTVYFDGKTPLFGKGADRIKALWKSTMQQYRPHEVLEEYVTAHELIYEIMNHMVPRYKETLLMMMGESQPGFDEKRGIVGKLFGSEVTRFAFSGIRYDSDLKI